MIFEGKKYLFFTNNFLNNHKDWVTMEKKFCLRLLD